MKSSLFRCAQNSRYGLSLHGRHCDCGIIGVDGRYVKQKTRGCREKTLYTDLALRNGRSSMLINAKLEESLLAAYMAVIYQLMIATQSSRTGHSVN